MDAIVKQAMAKWPNVPHCYGWLALDARGNWRMRDEQAQERQLAGERIANRALLDFINRNYMSDGDGRWYFQNGPQRAYVDLEATPYIARTDPARGFVLHTGEALIGIEATWLSAAGELILQSSTQLALVDDRDLAQCMALLRTNENVHDQSVISDEALLAWLEATAEQAGPLRLRLHSLPDSMRDPSLDGRSVAVNKLLYAVRDPQFAAQFGLVQRPRPASP